MYIKRTTDYSMFQLVLSNRDVDNRHVKKLSESIKRRNLMFIKPILVNDKMQVIDGQHRLEACKQINEPVYYLVVPELNKDDIAILNTAQKNWTMLDFINFYAIEGVPTYREVSKLINRFNELKVTMIITLACGQYQKTLRDGRLTIKDYKRAEQVCTWLRQLRNRGYEFAADRDFGLEVNNVIKDEIIFDVLISTINKENFYKCFSRPEYKRMLEKIVELDLTTN